MSSIFLDSKESYRFVDFPTPISAEDYGEALERYISRIVRFDEVRAIYQFGYIGNPGISDIDLLVILKDTLSHRGSFFSLKESDHIGGKRAFCHNPIFIPEGIWEELRWVIMPNNLKIVFGEPFLNPLENIPNLMAPFIAIAIAIEYFTRQIYWLLAMHIKREIPIRKAFAIIKSSTYLEKLIEEESNQCKDLQNENEEFRLNWFSKPDTQGILELLKKATEWLIYFNQRLTKKMKFLSQSNSRPPIYYKHSPREVSFFEDSASFKFQGKIKKYFNYKIPTMSISLPTVYGLHYMACAEISNGKGYGKLMNLNIKTHDGKSVDLKKLPENYCQAMSKRIFVANKQRAFLNKHMFTSGFLIDCGVFVQARPVGVRNTLKALFEEKLTSILLAI